MKEVPFDKTDRASIFKYSTGLIDHCLRDFANEEEILQNGDALRTQPFFDSKAPGRAFSLMAV